MANAPDTLEVTMLAQITGERYVDTGRKEADGSTIHDHWEWPKPGQRIRLPRAEALSLIHNELAFPSSMKTRPKNRTEAFLAAGSAG